MQSLEESWEHYFKSEVRSRGRVLFNKGKVSSSQLSDTEIQAYINASTSFKISFKTESVESESLTVDCTCPASKKGQLCKHIWATLLKVEKSYPDFLIGKKEIQKRSYEETDLKAPRKISQVQLDSQAAFKAKQADYRKQQYQKQKQRLKEFKQLKSKTAKSAVSFPPQVEMALDFFDKNGFPMEHSLSEENIRLAKKKLSQVFHPDIGGSHSEILELNKYSEILTRFLGL